MLGKNSTEGLVCKTFYFAATLASPMFVAHFFGVPPSSECFQRLIEQQHTFNEPEKETPAMARRCELTGLGPSYGKSISHAHNVSNRRFMPNLQTKRIWLDDEKKWITVKATAKALKTLDKKGYRAMMAELKQKTGK
jgi:large subunit ribosomal protein L28